MNQAARAIGSVGVVKVNRGGRPTTLTDDIERKLLLLVGIGYSPLGALRVMGITRVTARRWMCRRVDSYGNDLDDKWHGVRSKARGARQDWLDDRDRKAADILYPASDVPKEKR